MKKIKIITSKKSVCLSILLIVALTLNVHSGTWSIENKNQTNVSLLSVKEQLENAKKEGKAVFLVITGTGATGVTELVNVANNAKKKLTKSVVVQMNRDDAANSELVTKFGVSGVQLPFVLVLSAKGYAVGGFPGATATADNLVKLVPSPKYDEVLTALNNKKPVFVVASKKSFTDKATVIATCKTAVSKVPSTPAIVEIDMNDAKEATFLKQIGVNMASTSTVTVVINTTGNITGTYTGTTDAQVLAAAATKVVKSCCPGGSSSCGPKK